MEHDELDDIFKNILNNDNSELSEKERASKENIWEAIDRPKKEMKFSLWGIAAAILLLLLMGSSYFFSQKISGQNQKFVELEKKYNSIHTRYIKLEKELQNREHHKEVEEVKKIEEVSSNFKNTIPKIIERETVFVYDTIWMEKTIIADPLKVIERDTVYIEVPQKKAKEIVKTEFLESKDLKQKQKTKKPSKIEFVFDKKDRIKPTRKNKILQINENGIAKKTKPKKSGGVITIPINN